MRFKNANYVKYLHLKCDFCEKGDFENAIFVKKQGIFCNCDFCEKRIFLKCDFVKKRRFCKCDFL